ncbi:hypothetical protein [Vibrio phage vB_pir03]|nr:hypothetical protein [Vibrio phage vB_pir03]
MIDPDIANAIVSQGTRWNPKVCHGMAIEEFPDIPKVIDMTFHQAFKDFDKLKYLGCCLADPKEAYAEIVRPRGNKNQFEQSLTTSALYRFNFSFAGESMRPRYMYLPFLDGDGLMTIKDSRYVVSPTLSDQFFSIEEGKVFIPIPRAPVNVYREDYYYHCEGRLVPVDVHCARLHFTAKDEAPPSRHPQLLNYYFCLWGATEAFRYMGMEVAIIAEDAYSETDFPEDEWVKCTSAGKKPKMRLPQYTKPDVVLMVKKEHHTRITEAFIASFFYILDNCADLAYMRPENMEDPNLWKRALSRFIWRNPSALEAIEQIENHLGSLEEYIDESVRRRIRVAGLPVETIWELFRYVMMNFQEMTIKTNPASTFGKELRIIEPIIHDMVIMIHRLMFNVRGLDPVKFRKDVIEDLFNRGFSQNLVVKLASGHPEISLVESATDSKTMKITSLMYRPSKNGGTASASDMKNPMYFLDSEMLEPFSLRMITKSSPTASNRIRPAIKLGPNNEVLKDPLLDGFREEFNRLK